MRLVGGRYLVRQGRRHCARASDPAFGRRRTSAQQGHRQWRGCVRRRCGRTARTRAGDLARGSRARCPPPLASPPRRWSGVRRSRTRTTPSETYRRSCETRSCAKPSAWARCATGSSLLAFGLARVGVLRRSSRPSDGGSDAGPTGSSSLARGQLRGDLSSPKRLDARSAQSRDADDPAWLVRPDARFGANRPICRSLAPDVWATGLGHGAVDSA